MIDIVSVPFHIESDDPWHKLFSRPIPHPPFQTTYPCVAVTVFPPDTPFRRRWRDNNDGDIRYHFWSNHLMNKRLSRRQDMSGRKLVKAKVGDILF